MKSLAIVSSYNERCGNASYTHALKKEFSKHLHVDVIPLKTKLLRYKYPRLMRVANEHIAEIATKLRKYDFVNIQFEAGLFGLKTSTIFNRVTKLIEASRNLVFTMHRADFRQISPWWEFCRVFNPLRPKQALKAWRGACEINNSAWLTSRLAKQLKRAASQKNVWMLVHTPRDSENLRLLHRFEQVVDYPLTFLSSEEKSQYRGRIDVAAFNAKYHLPPAAKTIGVFGFINPYKGIDTVIKSLRFLPEDYHLLVFGSQHPLNIQENVRVDNYLEILLKQIDGSPVRKRIPGKNRTIIQPCRKPEQTIHDRVHFIGSLDDDDFLKALCCCNHVVLPYLEVGQGMSGIAVLALELRARALFANNFSFFELQKYAPGAFPTFDIGNYLELAEKIRNYESKYDDALGRYSATYNLEANIQMQIGLFERNRAISKNGLSQRIAA